MQHIHTLRFSAILALVMAVVAVAPAAENSKRLIQFDAKTLAKQIKTSDEAKVAATLVGQGAKSRLLVTCQPGAPGYPGIAITAPGDAWDLSSFGHVEMTVENTGAEAIDVALRVDNPGDWKQSPWNTDHKGIPAGGTGTVRVTFGYSFGNAGYALDPKRVSQVLVFVTAKAGEQTFQIASLSVGGKPGEKL